MSTLNDTDTLLVNRGGSSYRLQVQDFDSKITDTDILLVNRGGSSYQVTRSNLFDKLLDTDLMLVNRGGSSYQINGSDVKAQLDAFNGWSAILTSHETETYTYNAQTNLKVTFDENDIGNMFDGNFNTVFRMQTSNNFNSTAWFDISNEDGSGVPNMKNRIAIWFGPDALTYHTIRPVLNSNGSNNGMPLLMNPGLVEWSGGNLHSLPNTYNYFGINTSDGGYPVDICAVDLNYDGVTFNPVIRPAFGGHASTLSFPLETDMSLLNVGDQVTQPGAVGTVAAKGNAFDRKTLSINDISGTWVDGVEVRGPEIVS